nr:uncharacterized protein LOC105879754 [Microcebus murinus]
MVGAGSAAARALHSAGAEDGGRRPHAPRAARDHGARGWAGGGGGCAGPRPAATIPPGPLTAESRARRCPGRPAGTPGVQLLGTSPAGGSGQGRGWLRAAAATCARRRAPRRGSPARRTLCPSPPPLPLLPPARRAPLSSPSFSSPSLPCQAPARPPDGQFTARRGGAGRALGRASSALRGDGWGLEARRRPGGSPFRRTRGVGSSQQQGRGPFRVLGSLSLREGGGARSLRPAQIARAEGGGGHRAGTVGSRRDPLGPSKPRGQLGPRRRRDAGARACNLKATICVGRGEHGGPGGTDEKIEYQRN